MIQGADHAFRFDLRHAGINGGRFQTRVAQQFLDEINAGGAKK